MSVPQIKKMEHRSADQGGVLVQSFSLKNWDLVTNKCHILNSKCTSSFICDKTRQRLQAEGVIEEAKPEGATNKPLEVLSKLKQVLMPLNDLCNFCKYDLTLSMAHFPDMTYSNNSLRLEHKPSGLVLEFNTMEALFPVLAKSFGLPNNLKVAPSEAWLKARMDSKYTQNVMNAKFDWTFSSDYRGSLRQRKMDGDTNELIDIDEDCIELGVSDQIDLEKLKEHKEILFYDEIDLFEDELADHGMAKCSVKIRFMDDSFFILLRYFLRVDNVFVRYFDTRYYHEFGQNFMLREFTNREATVSELKLPECHQLTLLSNPAELYTHVPRKIFEMDKVILDKNK